MIGKMRKILIAPNPILYTVCSTIVEGEDVKWMDDLEKTCRKCKTAVGLAAPQIGITKRGIFILCKDTSGTIRGIRMFNPKIIRSSDKQNIETEGCLSYPEIKKKVRRPYSIIVEYRSSMDTPIKILESWDYQARVIQHEIDHLDGICKVGDPNYFVALLD